MLYYTISFILLVVAILVYFKLADTYNIIDKPNQRSSHSAITIRGGGIIFPIAALLWFFLYGFQQPWMIAGLLAMAVISFLDDVLTLSSKIRIMVHLMAVSLLFWQLQLFSLPWFLVLFTYVFTIGWINAFNFMDGINGITVLYSMVSLLTLYYLDLRLNLSINNDLLILLILSTFIFSWFNLRKRAKTFAGDVGSVTMAFLLAYLMMSLILSTQRPEYILMFSVYGIDSVITIVYRLARKENIFQAHRSHLYQYVSNELRWPHVSVSLIYALMQLLINALIIYLISINLMTIPLAFGLLVVLTFLYIVIRHQVISTIKRN